MAAKLHGGRPEFRSWVDKKPDPGWDPMPLTHIAKGLVAEDIIRDKCIKPSEDKVFDKPLSYFFYGRPAYRISGDGSIRIEAACPFCFIFEPNLIKSATALHAFDTGAFAKRMYKSKIMDEMAIEDFSLEKSHERANKIINCLFLDKNAYFDGDITKIGDLDLYADAWDFLARGYLELIRSRGRNEPDDRICSIEAVFAEDVRIEGSLRSVVVPHTLWSDDKKAPWLESLSTNGVLIAPYVFIPGRHPEYYLSQLEQAVKGIYKQWGAL